MQLLPLPLGLGRKRTKAGVVRPRIRLLPESTINRIAAGEVIERPAAALRELVENALDAGATRIAVSLEGGWHGAHRGGRRRQRHGRRRTGAGSAAPRHQQAADDDLVRITTLGFRGEALPSIGAAARLCVTTRRHGAAHAWTLGVEGGAVGTVAPAAGPPGTCVVVRDLFFATPARRKFLKSDRAEAEASEAAVRRLALAAPGVAFRLQSDGRVAFDLPAQDRPARVAALLGPDAASVLLPVSGERGGAVLSGFACAPGFTRATAAGQALVVNGRPVADPVLRIAVRVAYRDVIAAGRHPVVALFLDLPPEALDVNVHPAKAEVRFRDPDSVRGLVIGALGRALSGGAGTAAPPRRFAARPPLRLVPPARQPPGLPKPSWPSPDPLPPGPAPCPRPSRRRTRTRWARRWRRCGIPTSSPWPKTAAWCWSTSTRRMSG